MGKVNRIMKGGRGADKISSRFKDASMATGGGAQVAHERGTKRDANKDKAAGRITNIGKTVETELEDGRISRRKR